ncbi:Protein LOW PSII ACCUMULATION 1, chloroplastic [Linum grandiflorum]
MAAAAAAVSLNQHLLFLSNSTTGRSTSTNAPLSFYLRRTRLISSPPKKKRSLSSITSSSSSSSSSPASQSPEDDTEKTAESCVNLGLSLFSRGRVKDALLQFETALSLDPNPIEAQAALYNKACCHAYRGEGKKVSDCLRTALKEYNLKFSTILNDPDLASFRALPEFKELQEEARLGGEDIGESFRRDLKLISEVQAPFRGVRRFFYLAFIAAAGISTFFTVPRLVRAILGGDGAPDLSETAGNTLINIGAGKKETVNLAMQKAERFRTELLRRGVLLVPVIWDESRRAEIEKKGFGTSRKAAAALPSIGEDFEKRAQSVIAKSKLKAEIRFKAEVVSPAEWERWIRDQQISEGVTPGEDVYIILRLDGRVRRSGKGIPEWAEILKELPPMEALLSKLER